MTNGEGLKRPSDSNITNNGTKKQKVDDNTSGHTNTLFTSEDVNKNGSEIIPSDSQLRNIDLESLPVGLLQSASVNPVPDGKRLINQDTPQNNKLDNTDPSKLNDAIAAAGVDIQQEEELLFQQQYRKSDVSKDLKQIIKTSQAPGFLNNYHLAAFMNKVAKENGIQQNFLQDSDMLELVSGACENWLSGIATKTIMLSRHRRRGIPNTQSKRGHHSSSNIPRSELSKELRNIAIKQKELEEKRVSKRILLGLEKSANDPNGDVESGDSKAGVEETLHRAANATAAMMTMNPGRKKYSWMTSSGGTSGSDFKNGSEKDGGNKQSPIISIRGDNGLRFREIRSGNSIVMKDILGALEDERVGADKAIIKGYAKLKD